jgi:hypothetical protein
MAPFVFPLPWAYFAEVATKAEWERERVRGKGDIIFTPTLTRLWRVKPPPSRGREY